MANRYTVLDQILPFAIVGGGYMLARNGVFGADIQRQIHVLEQRLKGGSSGAVNPPGLAPPVGGSGGGTTSPCNSPAFIPGVQYVDRRSDGTFGLVLGGAFMRAYSTQAAAESAYRVSFGCAG